MSNADLIRLWEEHTKHEFTTRDTEATLDTMVDDAYVNHVPTMTGGFGKAALRESYSRDFIPSMPPDTTLTPVSRTVGEDQLVDRADVRLPDRYRFSRATSSSVSVRVAAGNHSASCSTVRALAMGATIVG